MNKNKKKTNKMVLTELRMYLMIVFIVFGYRLGSAIIVPLNLQEWSATITVLGVSMSCCMFVHLSAVLKTYDRFISSLKDAIDIGEISDEQMDYLVLILGKNAKGTLFTPKLLAVNTYTCNDQIKLLFSDDVYSAIYLYPDVRKHKWRSTGTVVISLVSIILASVIFDIPRLFYRSSLIISIITSVVSAIVVALIVVYCIKYSIYGSMFKRDFVRDFDSTVYVDIADGKTKHKFVECSTTSEQYVNVVKDVEHYFWYLMEDIYFTQI